MFNIKKNKIEELNDKLIWLTARNNMLEQQVKWYESRLNAQLEETIKWQTRCRELYKAQE